MAELRTGFQCRACHQRHDRLPLSYSFKAPLAAARIPPAELESRVVITRDQCVIDDTLFFLRGRIPIPILGLHERFIWGVWAEISPRNFIRTHDLWTTPGRESEPPYPGWLDSELPIYGTTLNLEVSVQTQAVGQRPHFHVVSQEHPLGREQLAGITMDRVEEIASLLCASGMHNAAPA